MDQPQQPGQHDPLKPNSTPPPGHEAGGPHPDSVPEAPPLTPMAWLMQNGVYIVLFLASVAWLYKNTGIDGLWRALLVVIGLSFVVFIHELGHFLAAKWCDVHVTTFSLGFGPALPGCSFVRGETTYMVGILPLGGYVAMVGEGPEADEEESYPRSFKNKTVAQRMLIISAGVVMNVILGAICFIFVYMAHGRERPMPVIAALEGGSPAWTKGVRSGADVTRINSMDNPYFDDLKLEVAVSQAGQKIPITFKPRDGKDPYTVHLEPRRENEDIFPVIGVIPSGPLRLLPERASEVREMPASYSSAGAVARMVPFKPGDQLQEAQVGDSAKVVPLEPGIKGIRTLCQLFRDHPEATIRVRVQSNEAVVNVNIEPKGIAFDDQIIGTTDPAHPDDTFTLARLPQDPLRDEKVEGYWPDPTAYRQRLRDLAGKPVALEVARGEETVHLLVPPSYTWVLPGVRLSMGQISAVRDDSEASKAELVVASSSTKGDVLSRVEAIRTDTNGKEVIRIFENVDPKEGQAPPTNTTELDPLRLPFDLWQFARAADRDPARTVRIKLTVLREDKTTHKDRKPTTIERVLEWDDSWDNQQDLAIHRTSPLTIPQLGLAYRVETIIDHVKEGSKGAAAGLKKGDRIDKVTFRDMGKLRTDEGKWVKPYPLETERYSGQKAYDAGANLGYLLQQQDTPMLQLSVHRDGKDLDKPIDLSTVLDENWYATSGQGFVFLTYDYRLVKADTVIEAMTAGVKDTTRMIKSMYLNLSSLLTGRISTKTLGGPIEIAAQTFTMAEDPYVLIFWLGIISINLAVVNFLPIPVLDGGHMVFLIYEWLRGRPPSQMVQAAATYVGLFLILSLMAFVIYLDVKRRFFGM